MRMKTLFVVISFLLITVFVAVAGMQSPETLRPGNFGDGGCSYGEAGAGTYDGGLAFFASTDLDMNFYAWNRTFGGSLRESGHSIIRTDDGGYIILGYTRSKGNGSKDFWLIKTDSWGNEEWDKTFGGTRDDYGEKVIQTSDGGYMLIGTTWSFSHGRDDIWLIKTDSQGNELWNRYYGDRYDDEGFDIRETSDGGYALFGTHLGFMSSYGQEFWLIKIDSEGNVIWDHTYGGYLDEEGRGMALTGDGGFLLVGSSDSYSHGSIFFPDLWVVKTDSLGNSEWEQNFGTDDLEIGFSCLEADDGNYIVLGEADGYWLLKLDADGNEIWDRMYGVGLYPEYPRQLIKTAHDSYLIVGTEDYTPDAAQLYVVETDFDGNILRSKDFGGEKDEYGYSVTEASSGGYVFVGYTVSYSEGARDVWMVRDPWNETSCHEFGEDCETLEKGRK